MNATMSKFKVLSGNAINTTRFTHLMFFKASKILKDVIVIEILICLLMSNMTDFLQFLFSTVFNKNL